MTTVKFFRKNGSFYKIECDGHTDFAVSGEDIVCAALSSIVQTAILGLLQVAGICAEFEKRDEDGYLKMILPQNITDRQKHDADVILNTLFLGVSDLYSGYSDFIELEVI
ncbi:MAG: ribosomal-processing cysteine protease Prp [Clostridiales bacterium]|nr:ribosomal-processing cysteine protease Prp [Clostridiales bacterium]